MTDKRDRSGSLKYNQIEEELKALILEEKIKPGEKMPSENVLSKQYGVSRQTVRKAISDLVNEGFVYAVQGSGTYCSDASRFKKDSKDIAVVMTYLSDYIFPKVISGIDSVLSENGYSIVLKNTNNSRTREIKCLEELIEKNIDGIIVEPSKSNVFCKHKYLYDKLDKYGIPYIFIQGAYSVMEDKPHVIMDDEKGAYLLTGYLISQGHKNIIGVFKSDDTQGQNRHKGYAKALAKAGLTYDPENVIWFYTEDRAVHPYTNLQKMIKSGKKVDAIVAYNDQIAFHLIKAIRELGLKVPQDISITGYDNSQPAANTDITLTTIVHPQQELGKIAAQMLLKMIRGEEVEKRIVVEPELVIGNSCIKRK
ncbi:MAG: GntR family transcriptional regulator [Butyrivibrio sp.]|uniref:GntR family transcriptional regulator n=1 Tax=Butyrivibrio sp. XB500-5 TaxID=2364880 RepID=UPI000EAA5ABA|nr:GntR family transcriptional regulator [Butyrivibrio sp. XB500-5]MBR4670240.1 GntR family transcriptional regulator [Butyrivibrio sp.]RKM63120.1 GntR family transcriptional regulator [Butyrivibrio sp. XB500-5]